MRFTIYQESRQGGRSNNEDRIAYCYSRDALLMVVADGMGGHFDGEVAAQIAVQTLTSNFQGEARPTIADPFHFLQKGLNNAHLAIRDYTAKRHLADSPRTTCVACLVQDNIAYWAHAGDSRLFMMRGGKVLAQTRDHSRVRLLLEEGVINKAQAATHPDRNKIYSCLGAERPPEIDFSRKTTLEQGDILLLCSDGLWGVISGEMMAITLKDANLLHTMPTLLSQAETKAGHRGDNLSTVVVRWEESYQEESSSAVSTQAMGLDEVATKMDAFGPSGSGKADMSDTDIESAIDEIRSAIDKFNPGKPDRK